MGLGDFVKGIADGAKSIVKDFADTGDTLGKMGRYAVDPHHWDDIAEGAGKGIEFVANHPGAALKIGGQIAKEVAIDSVTTPSGLLTTGLALASGGLGLAGKVAEGAKVAKGIEAAGEVGKIAKGVSTAGELGKAAEAGASVSRLDKFLGAGVKVGEQGALERTAMSKLRDPLNLVSKGRTGAAEKILAGGGGEPTIGRQVLAGLVQGTSGTKPTQLAGMSDEVYGAQEAVWRVRAAGNRTTSVANANQSTQNAAKVTGALANPRKAAFDAATSPEGRKLTSSLAPKTFEEPGGQTAMDFGQAKPQGYGGPGVQQQLPLEWPQPVSQQTSPTFKPLTQPAGGGGTADSPVTTVGTSSTARGTARAPMSSRGGRMSGGRGLDFWQGPGREALGGISPGFDWRQRNWGGQRNASFGMGAKTARAKSGGGPDKGTTTDTSFISLGQQPEGSAQPNIKNPYIDEPVDFENMGAQFPKLKVTPGSTLTQPKSILGV